jgi:hypothetical protein
MAPLQPPTLATFRSWGSSAGAGRASRKIFGDKTLAHAFRDHRGNRNFLADSNYRVDVYRYLVSAYFLFEILVNIVVTLCYTILLMGIAKVGRGDFRIEKEQEF